MADNQDQKALVDVPESLRERFENSDRDFDKFLRQLSREELKLVKHHCSSQVAQVNQQHAHAKVRLERLENLTRGTIEKRLITALRTTPASRYKAIYPRRYREIPTHYSPKHIVIAEALFREMETEENRNMLDDFVDAGHPTYWLNEKDADNLLETDVVDVDLTASDFEWPHPIFMIVPPKGCFPNAPAFILLGRYDDTVALIAVTNRHYVEGKPSSTCVTVKDSAGLKIGEMVASTQDPYERKVASFAFATLLAMIAEPTCKEAAEPHHKQQVTGRPPEPPLRPDSAWSPTFLRFPQQVAESHGPEHASGKARRVHARRGHFRIVWTPAKTAVEMAVGKRIIVPTDKRRYAVITSIDENAVVAKDIYGKEIILHSSEAVMAAPEPRWVKRMIVGLKNRFTTSSD